MQWSRKPRGVARRARSRFDRALAVTLVAGVILLLILGLVFSIAHGSQQITTRATGLHNADETLRSATIVRAQVALAAHMLAVDTTFGTNSENAIDLSLEEVTTALGDIRTGIEMLDDAALVPDDRVRSAGEEFRSTVEKAVVLIREGDHAAVEGITPTVDERFQALVSQLEAERNDLATLVATADALLGRIGSITRFLVAFLVPAAVIFIYRELLLRQQRQLELERRLESERQLSQAREEFIANASHELRTPLTGISGLALMLAEDPSVAESETASELLDLIISESGDLARMVDDLLTTARLDAGALQFNFEDVAVEGIIEEVAEPMRRGGVDITVDCEPGYLRADRLRLRQVLRNLLSNARKYGGPHVEVHGRIEGRTYVCSVVDDGAGIPSEIGDRLFERFVHQGRESVVKDSVGLGLAIVQALVQGMGGSVSYSRVGGKTQFVVRLPLSLGTDLAANRIQSLAAGDG
jgi:signal transduction histidine kinase